MNYEKSTEKIKFKGCVKELALHPELEIELDPHVSVDSNLMHWTKSKKNLTPFQTPCEF